MADTESYQSTTTVAGETSSTTISPEATTASTLLSLITEMVTDAVVEPSDQPISSETPKSVSLADLRFSTVDYCVFGVMLAMSGEIHQAINSKPCQEILAFQL